jgi:hypothetical protein
MEDLKNGSANGMDGGLPTGVAAKVIGVTAGTLGVWRWRGCGPAYHKVGRKVVYRRSELERFLQACVVTPGGHR